MTGQVLLLQPWVEDFYFTECRTQPVGLACLAGSLRRRFPDLDVRIIDMLAGGGKQTLVWPREFAYLKPYYGYPDHGPFSLFHQYYRFGRSREEILARLSSCDPWLIGISCLFTPYYRESLALARLCRELFPHVPIVMGGNHATLHPDTLLWPRPPFAPGEKLCDFVLRGEAEESLCRLVDHLRGLLGPEDIPNLVTRDSPRRTDIDDSPLPPDPAFRTLPDFQGLPAQDYRLAGRPLRCILTSRSCPHHCSFCTVHAVFGPHHTVRPVNEILNEMRIAWAEGIRHFDIEDDNFTFNKPHAHDLLDRLIGEGPRVTLSAMNGLSYLSLDGPLLSKMKRAGFESLNLSLVSSDEWVRRFTRRPHTLEKFREILRLAEELDLRTTAYWILGMPGQTVDEMATTLRFLAGERCLVGASPFYFTPGSPIHRAEKENPAIRLASEGRDPLFAARLTAMDLENEAFSRNDIYTLFRMSRLVNHVKQGLDLGLPLGDSYFQASAEVLSSGSWFAVCRERKAALPFSKRVWEEWLSEPLAICGYKMRRRIAWDAASRRWLEEGG